DSCKLAVEKGIIINTVQCGGDGECARFWKDICVKAEGSYVQIAQNGGVVAVATPFDKRLSEVNGELAQNNLCYGDAKAQKEGDMKKDAGLALGAAKPTSPGGPAAPAPTAEVAEAAARGAFASKARRLAANDLLDDLKEGKVKLNEVKAEELP